MLDKRQSKNWDFNMKMGCYLKETAIKAIQAIAEGGDFRTNYIRLKTTAISMVHGGYIKSSTFQYLLNAAIFLGEVKA